MLKEIPKNIENVIIALEKGGFEAYVVGGCVRDLLLSKEPKDWDLTTNARPEEVLKIFSDGKYENSFGTVLLALKDSDGNVEDVVEITTYRSEQGYNDRRHPDEVVFEDKLDKDLERRDFTINAMAMNLNGDVVDYFGGQKDLKKGVIRAVGEPMDRFKEDALRMVRAIRFSGQLGFDIEPKTERGIMKMSSSIRFVANERIRDELIKILKSDFSYQSFVILHRTNLLQYIIPELVSAEKVKQSRHHIYDVFEHSMFSLKHCPSKKWQVRMAALLHDIGKPKTRKIINSIATFYNHEYVSAKMTEKILKRLKFSNSDSEQIINLVRNHMFYYNVGEVTESSVRRLIQKTGRDNLKDLIDVRIADRLGSGVKKAKPYKLRHLEYMMEKVQNDPVSVKMLKINGDELIKILGINPGPKIGAILEVMLSEVIDDPQLNNKDYLEKRAKELNDLDIESLRSKAKEVIEQKREDDDKKIKNDYHVR